MGVAHLAFDFGSGREGGHRVDRDLHAEAAGEGHLAHGRPEAAIGAVMIGRHQPTRTQFAHRVDQGDQAIGVIEVGDFPTKDT